MNKQQNPMTRKAKLSVLIAGAVLGMTLGTSALAATTTTSPVTSKPTESVIGHAPTLTKGEVTVKDNDKDGVLGVGDELNVSGFVFNDEDGDKETPITYQWFDGSNAISGATKDTLTLTDKLLGKTISVKATAHTDPNITEPAESVATAAATFKDISGQPNKNGTGITTVDAAVVKSVTITGATGAGSKPLVKDVLAANVTCHGACDTKNLTYKWQIEKTAGTDTYDDIAGAISATYTVTGADQKRKIQVIVANK